MKLKFLIALISGLVISIHSFGQIQNPVHWSNMVKKTDADNAVIYIRATIDPGWHIYSTDMPDGGPVKTSFTFGKSADYELNGNIEEPAPLIKQEAVFKMQVRYFEKEVIFQQKIKLNGHSTIIKGHIKFMSCTDKQCLPPDDVAFSIPVK